MTFYKNKYFRKYFYHLNYSLVSKGVSLLRRLASNEFYESSWTINAFYSRENNAMVALNAYLQTPIYYGPNYPAPVNFAGVGGFFGSD